jgi:uncharacterized protein (TIGR03437 family)
VRILPLFCSLSFALAQHGVNRIPIGAMHVEGNRIVDSTGQSIVLRGAVIPGDDAATLTPTTFSTMRQRYNMNALRVPVSVPADLTRIATIVRQANAAGLVVIISASGGGDFWRAAASAFKSNPLVIFDIFNEPTGGDWHAWHDRMQGLVNMVRSTGATQLIAVQGFADSDFLNFDQFIDDPAVIYEIHPWFFKTGDRDARFGLLSKQVPVLAGAWGFIPHGISWTYSTFQPGNLYINYSDYYRTDLTASWTCNGTTPVGLGIGETIQYYLDGLKEGDLVPVSGAAGNIVGSARGGVVHIYGYQMSDETAAAETPAETLGGIRLEITDSTGTKVLAPLIYVSPYLVNAIIPASAALGPSTFRIGALSGPATIVDVQPGLFTGQANGRGPAIGFADGNPIWQCTDFKCNALPIDAASMTLIGAGFRNTRHQITATVGGFDVPVLRAGALDGAPGVDSIDLAITADVRGLGETDVLIFADGIASNAVRVNLARNQ